MESYDATAPADISQSIPQGLLENVPEKNVGESQMAEFSTPLDEVVPPGPGMQFQDAGFAGPPMTQQQQAQPAVKLESASMMRKPPPFGLTHDQYMAALAGLAAVISTSKPIQERLSQMLPNIEPGSAMAMGITALVAAIVFYLALRFLN
jgi:hypothetical protein